MQEEPTCFGCAAEARQLASLAQSAAIRRSLDMLCDLTLEAFLLRKADRHSLLEQLRTARRAA
jgi:hypothetical protein